MSPFEIDWSEFIERLAVWDRLSLPARKAFAELKPDRDSDVARFGRDGAALVAAGFLGYSGDNRRVRLRYECQLFAAAIRAMTRNDILVNPTEGTCHVYLYEHLTTEQRTALTPPAHRYDYGGQTYLGRQVRTVTWLDRLQTGEECSRWEKGRDFGQPLLTQPGILAALRQIVAHFKTLDGPVPLRDLPARFPTLPAPVLGKAIRAGVRYLFLFPAMRSQDMTPVIGLWPEITERLHRPEPTPPQPVTPDDTYHSAILMDDMTCILVAATTGTLRIRANDGALFAKAQKEITAGLASIPEWLEIDEDFLPPQRINAAVRLLQILGYIETAESEGSGPALQITDRGALWLAEDAKKRLMAIFDRLNPNRPEPNKKRQSPAASGFRRFPDSLDEEAWNDSPYGFPLIPSALTIPHRPDWNSLAALSEAFKTLSGNDFVPLHEFLAWHSRKLNPLFQLLKGGKHLHVRMGWAYYEPSEEEAEALWDKVLFNFAWSRLLPLGGLRIGILGKGRLLSISLTDAGRYLLGLVDDFDYGPGHDEDQPVLVQPNFDVVFTSPSPQTEATIGRFAQRVGQRVGTLFKITKSSVFAAACTGMTAQQVLDALRHSSAKKIPSNVEREIQGWFGQCRRVAVRRAIVVDCPDAHTAARVLAAGGKNATALTETIIELAGSKPDAALFRKLDAMGIFSHRSSPSAQEGRKKGPRSRRRR
ncbi:MAG: helicase-associated domain-containing protein [Thermoguttaceae bacterium]